MIKSKTKIAIASVLKPIDDVRNFEKLGRSLSKDEKNQVFVLGYPSVHNVDHSSIQFIKWPLFSRMSFGRFKVQIEFWKSLRRLKPDVVICTTFELLFLSGLFKILYGSKLIYDIQEDYFKNLWHQHVYPPFIRHILAIKIRILEWLMNPMVDKYFLAEKVYRQDISFARNKSLIIENKSLEISKSSSSDVKKVIFSGTLTRYSRALESIELYQKLAHQLDNSEMIVIGYAPEKSYRNELLNKFSSTKNITLKVSDQPVPHGDISAEISQAYLAIIGYKSNPINQYKVPTKLYEYTTANLPYLIAENTYWSEVGSELGGAIPISFDKPELINIQKKIEEIKQNGFSDAGFLWSEQEDHLINTLFHLIS